MEVSEYGFQDQECHTSFARGGPIYVPDLISTLTSVPEFKASTVQELQDLESELSAAEDFNDELTVDELKFFTEEDFVEKALKEFEDAKNLENSSPLLIEYSKEQTTDDLKISGNKVSYLESSATDSNNSEICISLNGSSVETGDKDYSRKEFVQNPKKRKKRGRFFDRNSRAPELESSRFAKVEQIAKVKQKQDEDKAAARLHSFNGNLKSAEAPVTASEKIERMRSLRFITTPMKVKSSNANEHVPLFYPEVVLCVEIYHNRITWKKTQEFLVLGSQTLTELRDNIYCVMDQMMQTSEEHDPSGYFLIEDCFCNDLRDSSAIDYSKPIFDWLRNCKKEAEEKWEYVISGNLKGKQKELLGNLKASNLPQFKAVNMHKIRFCDLQFRLGAGYLYCHQGDCKHVVVIRDMRLIHPEDDQNRAAYPIITFQHRHRYRKCSVCHIYRATKVTVDDKWTQKNPCYFCDNCHYLLHYKEDGSLLYNDFTVFDYHHEM